MVKADIAEQFLANQTLLEMDLDARRALLKYLDESQDITSAVLLKQGEPNDHLSFLMEGSAVIERIHPRGDREVLAQLNAPALYGTISFFRPTPPTICVRAITPVRVLTMGHPAHDALRRDDPRTAEALAIAVVRILAERFDLLDQRFTAKMAADSHDHRKVGEWSGFRARLFEDSMV